LLSQAVALAARLIAASTHQKIRMQERNTRTEVGRTGQRLMSLSTSTLIASSDLAAAIACFHVSKRRLFRRDKPGAEIDAGCASMSAAAIPRPSKMPLTLRREWRDRIDHLRHKRHRADVTAIAADLLPEQ
jgi:hypothetical protein